MLSIRDYFIHRWVETKWKKKDTQGKYKKYEEDRLTKLIPTLT